LAEVRSIVPAAMDWPSEALMEVVTIAPSARGAELQAKTAAMIAATVNGRCAMENTDVDRAAF